jgi:para-nitrobenzyl esterase
MMQARVVLVFLVAMFFVAATARSADILGVPYAAAPTGELRWRAPQPGPPWNGSSGTPPRCPQSAAGLAAGTEREDCLYLNIHSPAQGGKQRPVFVYVHGGGAVNGSANDHDGRALAQGGDMLVVTVNYRLGALGFMDSALFGPAGGNYGVLDVIAALQWVRQHIAGFGGDPGRVTLGGESAGGTVLCPLLTMPQAKGLFRAAIISSDDCLHDVDTPEAGRARAARLANSLSCSDAACLRQLTPARLVKAGGKANPSMEPSYYAIARAQWHAVPLMIGANSEEGRIAGPGFMHYDATQYRAWLATLASKDNASAIEQQYRELGKGTAAPFAEKISAIITDSGMRGFGGCTSLQLARNAARQAPVYYYQFEDSNAPTGQHNGFRLGAAHAAELAYLWPGAVFAQQAAALNQHQRVLSTAMIARWAAFVHHATPNAEGLDPWPSVASGAYMAFDAPHSRARPLASFDLEHHCDFWRSQPIIMERGEP